MNAELPEKLSFLFEPYRYKGAFGGRGGAKSWGFATALLIQGAQQPLRIGCGREIQKSISDSVHQLMKDRIQSIGLEKQYKVRETYIEGSNGTLITFHGLRHNIQNIKSLEGCDRFWVEEAEAVSKTSWDTLIPTIRKPGSEIWLTWNPDLEEAETHQRFVVSPPPSAKIIKMTWRDNPYFPDVLRQEKDYLKQKDPSAYENVWEGHCKAAVAGAIFAKELQRAAEEGRITKVPYERAKPVDLYFDLGRNDKTAIWATQQIGYDFRLLRYYENSGEHFSHYSQVVKTWPYSIGTIYLPHDAENEQLSAEKTIKQQAIDAFPGCRVVIIPRIPQKALAIDAARGIFDRCIFDSELCADGITCLRRYAYKVDPETGRISREPEHDTPWSHGADAFLAVGQSTIPTKTKKPPRERASIIRRSGIR
jgi:phage terminase large subunit